MAGAIPVGASEAARSMPRPRPSPPGPNSSFAWQGSVLPQAGMKKLTSSIAHVFGLRLGQYEGRKSRVSWDISS